VGVDCSVTFSGRGGVFSLLDIVEIFMNENKPWLFIFQNTNSEIPTVFGKCTNIIEIKIKYEER
jgi:hypothetical protein